MMNTASLKNSSSYLKFGNNKDFVVLFLLFESKRW